MHFMAQYGAKLVDAGFHILPLAPGQKYPGAYRNRTWGKMYGWSEYAYRQPSPLELHHWSQWPGAGIGVVAGNVVAIDIDILDADTALKIDQVCRDRLGDTPALRIGQHPKRLLVYRTTEFFKSESYGPLEILCLGRQFVAYGIHPRTGQPYSWPEEGLAELDIGDLPKVSGEDVAAFVQMAISALPAGMFIPKTPHVNRQPLEQLSPTGFGGVHYSETSRRGTAAALEAAMAHIANPDVPYDQWIRIGLALKGALPDGGWPLFDTWSRKSVKYRHQVTLRTWNSMRPNSIGAGTIYYLACLGGWKPDPNLQLNGDFEEQKQRLLKLSSRKG